MLLFPSPSTLNPSFSKSYYFYLKNISKIHSQNLYCHGHLLSRLLPKSPNWSLILFLSPSKAFSTRAAKIIRKDKLDIILLFKTLTGFPLALA